MSADTKKYGRRRVERRLLPPFGDGLNPNHLSNRLDSMLEGCRFCPFSREPTVESSYYLEPGEADRPIRPFFVFALHHIAEVLDSLSLAESHLELVVSARNRRLKRYKALGRWSVVECPERWSPAPRDLDDMQTGGGGIEFILGVRIAATGPTLAEQGLGPGRVLCRREFAVRQRVDAVAFPFSWREFGKDSDYPSELLWVVKWEDATDDDRFSRPISEALTVYMNKAAEECLVAMSNAFSGQGEMVWKMLAAEIVVLIWSEVLRGVSFDPDPSDTETLAGQVYAHLARVSGKSYGDFRDMAEEDGLLELRSCVARIIGVVE